MIKPVLSIVTFVAYPGRQKFHKEIVDRLLNEKFPFIEKLIEIVVVNYEKIPIQTEFKRLSWKNFTVKFVESPSMNFAEMKNTGWKFAEGDYVFMLDDDDLIAEDFFSKVLGLLSRDRRIDVIGLTVQEFGLRTNLQKSARGSRRELIQKFKDGNITVMFPIFKKREYRFHQLGENDFTTHPLTMLDFLLQNGNFIYKVIEKPLYYYRIHNSSVYSRDLEKAREKDKDCWSKIRQYIIDHGY